MTKAALIARLQASVRAILPATAALHGTCLLRQGQAEQALRWHHQGLASARADKDTVQKITTGPQLLDAEQRLLHEHYADDPEFLLTAQMNLAERYSELGLDHHWCSATDSARRSMGSGPTAARQSGCWRPGILVRRRRYSAQRLAEGQPRWHRGIPTSTVSSLAVVCRLLEGAVAQESTTVGGPGGLSASSARGGRRLQCSTRAGVAA